MTAYRFAVLGNPIDHSLSPQIHQAFASQFSLAIDYQKRTVEDADFDNLVRQLISAGTTGINITVPHKHRAWRLCRALGTVEKEAQASQAINTMHFHRSGVAGYNTDGKGLVADFEKRLGLHVQGKTILIIGAGGAARGILPQLLSRSPAKIVVANRNSERAKALEEHFAICGIGFEKLKPLPFDIVIHATSAGLIGNLPPIPRQVIAPTTVAYDLIYSRTETTFCAWAKSCRAGTVSDGLGMLIEQAALAFHIWTGKIPNTEPLREILAAENR